MVNPALYVPTVNSGEAKQGPYRVDMIETGHSMSTVCLLQVLDENLNAKDIQVALFNLRGVAKLNYRHCIYFKRVVSIIVWVLWFTFYWLMLMI